MPIVEITQEEFDAAMKRIAEKKAERAREMPTTEDALKVMFRAWERLRELGWKEAVYCPKDGTRFDAIEAGSTGVHCCHYSGEWPTGHWWVEDEGDLWPSRPILWRPSDAADPAEPA